MSRLLVVSNRVPSLERSKKDAGGLAVGIEAALRKGGGVWFGWSGQVNDQGGDTRVKCQEDPFALVTTDLSAQEHEHYYLGFSNRVLWPALHSRLGPMQYCRDEYLTYAATNARLARHVRDLSRPDDLIWVHDYHLMLLGRDLRALGATNRLGFFLHTPFPSADAMAAVPNHRDIAGALTHFDLVGFQSGNDRANFRDYVARHLGGSSNDDGTVRVLGRSFRVAVFPIGIDVQRFRTLASARPDKLGRLFEPWLQPRCGFIGVERLDYTKGLIHRLQAFDRLLAMREGLRGSTFLLQIAAPSREAIDDYKELRSKLQALAGSINSRYGDIGWTPVHYINRSFSHAKLAKLYRECRAAVVTPLRDGMNMVAKEFVAAQDPDDPGVLILSAFAGAAERLTSALIVNPFDLDGVAEAMSRAIDMPLEERRERWSVAINELETHDIHDWSDAFLSALQAVGSEPYVAEVKAAGSR